jgi:fluoride exporter
MIKYFLVFLGGGIGAVARYSLQGFVHRYTENNFPYGTFAVNVIGCFVLGYLMVAFEERFLMNPSLRLFLTIGILGGFTTFSSFSYETIALLRGGEWMFGISNILASVLCCLLATFAGMAAGKVI